MLLQSESRSPRHFDGKRFYNPDGRQAPGLLKVLRWKLTSRPQPSPGFISDVEQSVPPSRVEDGTVRVTVVNHATVLIQQRGVNILTDPIWSKRASPFAWVGPQRRRKPGIAWQDLPPIDAVLISHNHYDHLDLPTLSRLASRGVSTFIVPTGVARLLSSKDIGPVHELDWGESLSLRGVTFHCVPAVHFASRGVFDRNRTLWCGYVIECPERLLYFAGDTAFGDHFAHIREQFGPPDVALLPIGAYQPRWIMSPVHMAPDEAVKAHEIMAVKTSIAIHHGTFQLTDEALDMQKKELLAQAQNRSFLVLNNGQFAGIS